MAATARAPGARSLGSKAERELLVRLRAPGAADSQARELTVSAAFVRDLITARQDGAPLGDELRFGRIRIVDRLDLSNIARPALRLSFDNCVFAGGFSASGAALASLSLTSCVLATFEAQKATIGALSLDGVEVAGGIALDGLRGDSTALRRSKVRGQLGLSGARLSDELVLRATKLGTGKVAITADHVEIGLRLRLEEGVQADGSVSLVAARIEGVRLAGGADIDGGLDLSRARIEGVRLEPGASLNELRLDRVELGDLSVASGALVRDGVFGANLTVRGRIELAGEFKAGSQGAVIDLASADIAGDLDLAASFMGAGPLRLSACTVAGAVALRGVLFAGSRNALDISRLTCGRLSIEFTQLAGGVSVRQSECTGLNLGGAYSCDPDLPLHLGVHCSGRVAIGGGRGVTRIVGTLSLIGHVAQELSLRNLVIDAHPEGRWAGVAIAARHLKVATVLRIGDATDGRDGVVLSGLAAFDHAQLGDAASLAGVRMTATASNALGAGPVALSLGKAALVGDLQLGTADAPLAATGGLDLSGMTAAGDVVFESLELAAAPSGSDLGLSDSKVEGALRIGRLQLDGGWTIDLEGARVGRLDDTHGAAWSAHAKDRPAVHMASFQYDDVQGLSQDASAKDAVSARLAWIEEHGRAARERGAGFNPRPYRVLSSILSTAGFDEGVRRTELFARRQQRLLGRGPWPLKLGGAVLELTSGYGYAPVRAALALVVYYLIGWAGVELAQAAGVFEASPFMDGSVLTRVADTSPKGCPWLKPPLYALDLMVPLTTLGNENFCSIRAENLLWHWATVIYRLFGWVLLSIAVLTFAGIMKREV